MKTRTNLLLVIALLAAALVGCSQDQDMKISGEAAVKPVKSFYPNDIGTVNRIEMLSAAGERQSFDNRKTIARWLEQIGALNVTVNPDPEDHNGDLFTVTLFEGKQKKFVLTPTLINGTAIFPDQGLTDQLHRLWRNGK